MQSYMVHNQINFKVLSKWTLKIWVNNISVMADKFNLRWAFNASTWLPNNEDILKASTLIQPEERQKISKYVFLNDAKSSLIGRLMMRKFINVTTPQSYEMARFGRDERGKPFVLGAGDTPVNFNVSHQGDYVVLAGNSERNIGIDVMKIEPPVNKNIPEFFRLMRRQFSSHEWATIRRFPSELEQIACFYRNWCLKESYVKNIGLGITIPLQEISFSMKAQKLSVGEVITDTTLYVNNILKDDWVFEETLLDEMHAVAVSMQIDKHTTYEAVPYMFFTFDELVKDCKPIFDVDRHFSDNFMSKSLKDF